MFGPGVTPSRGVLAALVFERLLKDEQASWIPAVGRLQFGGIRLGQAPGGAGATVNEPSTSAKRFFFRLTASAR